MHRRCAPGLGSHVVVRVALFVALLEKQVETFRLDELDPEAHPRAEDPHEDPHKGECEHGDDRGSSGVLLGVLLERRPVDLIVRGRILD